MNRIETDRSGEGPSAATMLASRLHLFLLFYFVLSLILYQFFFFPEAHWSGDSAIKCFQAEILLKSDFHSVAIPWLSKNWDAEGKFFPYIGAFARQIDGQYYFTYPLMFVLLLAIMKGLLGILGVGIVVASGSTLLLYLTYRLAETMKPGSGFSAILILGFATPVWIYSSLVWAHTIAAAFFVGAIWLPIHNRQSGKAWPWILGGVLAAIGTWFRTEGYAFTASIMVAIAVWGEGDWKIRLKRSAYLLCGFGIGQLPVLMLNRAVYGTVWGLHAGEILRKASDLSRRGMDSYLGGPRRRWVYRFSIFEWLLVRSVNYPAFSLKTAIPFALFVILMFVPRLRQKKLWVQGGLALIVVLLARVLWEVVGTESRHVTGLLIVMPYSVMALWFIPMLGRGKTSEDEYPIRLLLGIVAVFLFASTFLNLGNHGGLQWGPRYLMPIFPILVLLALYAYEKGDVFRGILGRSLCGILLAIAIFLQVFGFWVVREDEVEYAEMIDELSQAREVAIVGYRDRWVVQTLSPLYFRKRLFYVGSPAALKEFLDREKPFSNQSVIVLTRKAPLETMAPEIEGTSKKISRVHWRWSPPG